MMTLRSAAFLLAVVCAALWTAVGVERVALAAGQSGSAAVDAGALPIVIPPPPTETVVVPAGSTLDPESIPPEPTRSNAPMPTRISVDDPQSTLVELVAFARTGKGRVAIGCAIVLLVWLLRNHILKRIKFFTTRLGGYVAGFGTAAVLYVGLGLGADFPLTVNMICDALLAGFAASGQHELLGDLAARTSAGLRMGAISLLLIVTTTYITVSACGAAQNPTVSTIVNCIDEHVDEQAVFEQEVLPLVLGVKPDWQKIKDKAITAGVSVGGCVLADLVQRYLAPAPGRKAPAIDAGHAAREALETYRAKYAGNATFRTVHGDL